MSVMVDGLGVRQNQIRESLRAFDAPFPAAVFLLDLPRKVARDDVLERTP